MTPIHILTTLDSDTPHLPQLQPLVGKSVEIIVYERQPRALETEATFLGGQAQPVGVDQATREAMRGDPRYARFWPLLDALDPSSIDVDAIVEQRAGSPA